MFLSCGLMMKKMWFQLIYLSVFCVCFTAAAEAEVSVLVGGTAVMTCPIGDVTAYRTTWMKGSVLLAEIPQVGPPIIPPTGAGRVSVNGSDVIIQGVALPDEGSYSCSVLDTSFATVMSTVDLLVRVQPEAPVITMEGSPAAGQLQPGTNLTLVCHSWWGRPAAQLSWYRDGQEINGSYASVEDPDGFGNATLTVPLTVTEADDGAVYECVSSGPTPVVTQTTMITLNVATVETTAMTKTTVPPHVDSPEMTTHLPSGGVSALAGTTARLSCDVGNIPVLRISWSNDRGLVAEQTTGAPALIPPTLRDRVQVNGSDVIMDPVLVSDEGQYTCTVLHRDTFQSFTDTVDLLVRVQPEAPVITMEGSPAAGQLQPGTNLTLVCHSWRGRPAAQLSWYRDGQVVNGVYTSAVDADGYGNATLTTTFTVTEADDGVTYECVSSGPRPVVTERAEITLGVHFPTTTPDPTTKPTTTTKATTTTEATTIKSATGELTTSANRQTKAHTTDSPATAPESTGTHQTTGEGAGDPECTGSIGSNGQLGQCATVSSCPYSFHVSGLCPSYGLDIKCCYNCHLGGCQLDSNDTTEGGGVIEAQSGTQGLTEPQIILVVVGSAMVLVILVAGAVATNKGCFMKKREAELVSSSPSKSVGSSYRANILYANAGNGYDGPADTMEMTNKELIKPPPEKII
ncbi:hemicentin-1-like [Branchiostoma floridae x Branchiostoma japonicum]